MVTQYITTIEKITKALKDSMQEFPSEFMEYNMYLAQMAFKLNTREILVKEALKKFITLGYFEIVNGKIVSVIAQRKAQRLQDKKKKENHEAVVDIDDILNSSIADNGKKA